MIFITMMIVGGAIVNFINDFFTGDNNLHVPFSKKDIIPYAKKEVQEELNGQVLDHNLTTNDIVRQTPNIDITEMPFLLFGKFIHHGEIVCIYAKEGIGKTFMSIQIAKDWPQLKTVIFALDDSSDKQLGRYASLAVITKNEFNVLKEAIKASVEKQCQLKALIDFGFSKIEIVKDWNWIEERKKKLMKEFGATEKQKIDDILVLETYAESKLCSDASFIIIDSLNGLLGDVWNIRRENIVKIISLFQKMKERKTLCLLHHANKDGEIEGASSLSQLMDTVLKIEDLGGDYRKIIVKKDRYPQSAKDCTVKMVSEGPNSVRFEICDETFFGKTQTNLPPLEKDILMLLEGIEIMTFQDLYKSLILMNRQTLNKNSVKNSLRTLENKGFVTKTNGKDWSSITICMVGNDTSP